jgi:hypothetical protein
MNGEAPSMLHSGKFPRSVIRRLGPNARRGKLPLRRHWVVTVGKGPLGLICVGKETATVYSTRCLSLRGGKGIYVTSSTFALMIRAK